MKKSLTRILGVTVVLAGIACASPAHAITVNYDVGGWSQQFPGPITPPAGAPHSLDGWGYPGDTVKLEGGSDSFNLVDGATYNSMPIGTLSWWVDYTYNGTATQWDQNHWDPLTFIIGAIRSISIGTATGTISQDGTLSSTWADDNLSFSGGPMASIYVEGYRVDITPDSLPVAAVNNFNSDIAPPELGFEQTDRNMTATFKVTYVPDAGSTLILLGAAITGLGAFRRRLCA